MTSYVTREEYELLCGRLEKLEAAASSTVNITVSGGNVGEEIAALVRDAVRRVMLDIETRIDRYPPMPRR